MIDMTDCFLMEPQPCDLFEFSDAVESFDPNVEYIPGPAGPQGPQGPPGAPGEYGPQNPPPYPVTSVDGKTGAVQILPQGGAAGQVLKKRTADDGDVEWADGGGGGSGTVTAEDVGTVTPPDPFLLSVSEGGTGADNAAGARSNLGAAAAADLAALILTPTAAFAIPAEGASVSYDLPGLTDKHELVRWNFSASAENAPPVDLTWTTAAGYFTITNTGGTTAESILPVFALPAAVAITNH